jgi:hypothetical protein
MWDNDNDTDNNAEIFGLCKRGNFRKKSVDIVQGWLYKSLVFEKKLSVLQNDIHAICTIFLFLRLRSVDRPFVFFLWSSN